MQTIVARWLKRTTVFCAGWAAVHAAAALADASVTFSDPMHDVVARRTDPGADGPFDPEAHRLIDLLSLTIGSWTATTPLTDVFTGSFVAEGEFVRLGFVLSGLVNPPGSVNPSTFSPFTFGDHPVYGFIEIDMDVDVETGGELDTPQYRYLGNVARFGGKPSGDVFEDRVAEDATAFDEDFLSEPYVERHGEEFHLALVGEQIGLGDINELAGNGDSVFDAGETWNLKGPWFHRAHGYSEYSIAGSYDPECDLQFKHDVTNDTTCVSLVFPITNEAAASLTGVPPEPNDHNAANQASILEALEDLALSALLLDMFPTGEPEEAIIIDWKDKNPEEFLDPTAWRVTVLLGSSYVAPDPAGHFFLWSDVNPNVERGDVDGEQGRDADDREDIEEFIEDEDASDGLVDGMVTILGFAENFSVFDINHDGRVDAVDVILVSAPGDGDDDDDVDLVDHGRFQACFSGSGEPYEPWECALADLDSDGDVDLDDFEWFRCAFSGPDSE